jgi:hypothetical protein
LKSAQPQDRLRSAISVGVMDEGVTPAKFERTMGPALEVRAVQFRFLEQAAVLLSPTSALELITDTSRTSR